MVSVWTSGWRNIFILIWNWKTIWKETLQLFTLKNSFKMILTVQCLVTGWMLSQSLLKLKTPIWPEMISSWIAGLIKQKHSQSLNFRKIDWIWKPKIQWRRLNLYHPALHRYSKTPFFLLSQLFSSGASLPLSLHSSTTIWSALPPGN